MADEKQPISLATPMHAMGSSLAAAGDQPPPPPSQHSQRTGAAGSSTSADPPRFVEVILSALAQPISSPPQHVLIDFSDLPSSVCDSKVGVLKSVLTRVFGVSCEIVVGTPQTQPEDFYRSPPPPAQPPPLMHQNSGGGGSKRRWSSSAVSDSKYAATNAGANGSGGLSLLASPATQLNTLQPGAPLPTTPQPTGSNNGRPSVLSPSPGAPEPVIEIKTAATSGSGGGGGGNTAASAGFVMRNGGWNQKWGGASNSAAAVAAAGSGGPTATNATNPQQQQQSTNTGSAQTTTATKPQPPATTATTTSNSSTGLTGPIFSSILIVHRAEELPHHTLNVLLQAMRLRNITIDGTLHDLPKHSSSGVLVIATTRAPHQLPRGLCEDFAMGIVPDSAFFDVLQNYYNGLSSEDRAIAWAAVRDDVAQVFVPDCIHQYIRDIVVCVRQHARVAIGPSPHAAKSFLQSAKMHALLSGVMFVRPMDVDAVAVDSLSHRILLRQTTTQSAAATASAHSHANSVALHSRTLTHTARLILHHLITKVLMPPK